MELNITTGLLGGTMHCPTTIFARCLLGLKYPGSFNNCLGYLIDTLPCRAEIHEPLSASRILLSQYLP